MRRLLTTVLLTASVFEAATSGRAPRHDIDNVAAFARLYGAVRWSSTSEGTRPTFTGMRVTGHDGQATHHLVGIKPHISVLPTVAALRDGRDEVLEKAVALIRAR